MALAYLFDPNKQFQDLNGVNNVAGFLRVYYEGTDDRATTYKNFIGTMNPADIPIDNYGRAVVIVEDEKTYRLEVYARNGNLMWTQHPLCALVGCGGSFDQVQSNWDEDDPTSAAFIKNKPDLSEVATSGDYNDLSNKPTSSTASPSMDGIASAGSSTQWSRGDHVHPTDTSREAAANKTTTVRQNGQADNTRFPTEAAVRTAIDSAVSSAYHAAGTKTVAQLTGSLLVSANEGDVYNITDTGVTTSDFIEGAGLPIRVGDNVVVCDVGEGVYKFDLLSGFVDLTNYLTKTGDGSDVTASFTAASTRTNVTTGEKLSVLFGKIAKWLGDLKALAFKDTVTDSDISGAISDTHIASASTWNGKQNTISTDSDESDIRDATTIATGYGSDKVHLNTAARLWAYIQGKISTVLGLTSSTYGGTSGTAIKLPTAFGGFDMQSGYRLLAKMSAPSAYNDRICSFSVFKAHAGQTDPQGKIGTLTVQIRNNNGSCTYGAYYRGIDSQTFTLVVMSNSDKSASIYVYSAGDAYGGIQLALASSSGYQGNPTGLTGLTLYANDTIQATVTGSQVSIIKTVTPIGTGWVPLANSSGVGSTSQPAYVSSGGEILPCTPVYWSSQYADSLAAVSDGLYEFTASWPAGIDTTKDYILEAEVLISKAASELSQLNNEDLQFSIDLLTSNHHILSIGSGAMTNLRGRAGDYTGNTSFFVKVTRSMVANSTLIFQLIFPSSILTLADTFVFNCRLRFTEAP